MAKDPKHIKVNLGQPKPSSPPMIPDLVLNFASDKMVYTLWVPAGEMGEVAKMFCDLMKQRGIIFKLEEKPR